MPVDPNQAMIRARGEAAVGQHAQRVDRTGVPFEAGGLGARGRVPQPDRVVRRA